MKPNELRSMIHSSGSRPIRVCLNHGRSYVISHPDFAFVADGALILANGPGHDLGDVGFVICYFEHISRVEQLRGKSESA